jgi:hypothetical protein
MTRVICSAVLPGVEIGENQDIGFTVEPTIGDHPLTRNQRERGIGLHFSIRFRARRAFAKQRGRGDRM